MVLSMGDAGVTFHCVGKCDKGVKPVSIGGNALMGGHMYPGVTKPTDLIAYRWFLERASGGDVLVLTADDAPCDIYNEFLFNMTGTVQPNSVTTACFTSRDGSSNTKLQKLLNGASAFFITGGDQSNYFNFWKDTPVALALSGGAVVGGSSAGLAVQGQFVFDAVHGGVTSEDALKYPTDSEVSLARKFITVDAPWMRGVITDTHFFQRDRMGRLVAFVARIAEADWASGDNQTSGQKGVLGVGISEHTAVLVDHARGTASFVGDGPAYFLTTSGRKPTVCEEGKPLSWAAPGVNVWKWNATDGQNVSFDFGSWAAAPARSGTRYALGAEKGKLTSTQAGGAIY
jgi:cyanophycinase-like exopeptidase